jgi:tetratricopeptide (TPR) repeat protein
LRLAPADAAPPLALGNLLVKTGHAAEALAPLRLATSLDPDSAIAHANLTAAFVETGAAAEAIESGRQALTHKPDLRSVHQNLGLACLQLRRYPEALEAFLEAARRNPSLASASGHAALILAASPDATQRDGARALDLAQQAHQLTGGTNLTVLRALAAAQAERGQYAGAERTATEAATLAAGNSLTAMAETLKQDASLYRDQKPLRLPNVE